MELAFEWNPGKGLENFRKHGVSFEEASTVFGDPLAKIVDDPRHSTAEERYVIIGVSLAGRLLSVMFTERGANIRLMSARAATRPERLDYEEDQP
jgi:uncharacterized DUF497 family protein